MTVNYTVVRGRVRAENRNGVRKAYVADSLGSTIALRGSGGAITDTWEYWPYGEVRTRTGSTTTPFQYVGTLGYYTDLTGNVYVRARSYQPKATCWMSVDPLWPDWPAYAYARQSPTSRRDRTGLFDVGFTNCDEITRRVITRQLERLKSKLTHVFYDCLNQWIGSCKGTTGRMDPGAVFPGIVNANSGAGGKVRLIINCNDEQSGDCAHRRGIIPCSRAYIGNPMLIRICLPAIWTYCRPIECLLAHELIHLASHGVSHIPSSNNVLWKECMPKIPGCQSYDKNLPD